MILFCASNSCLICSNDASTEDPDDPAGVLLVTGGEYCGDLIGDNGFDWDWETGVGWAYDVAMRLGARS